MARYYKRIDFDEKNEGTNVGFLKLLEAKCNHIDAELYMDNRIYTTDMISDEFMHWSLDSLIYNMQKEATYLEIRAMGGNVQAYHHYGIDANTLSVYWENQKSNMPDVEKNNTDGSIGHK